MGNIRIKNLTATTSVNDSDAVAVDGSSTGTKRMLFSSLWDWIMSKTYSFSQGTLTIPAAINAINTKLGTMGSGTPKTVTLVAEMEDENTIYLYAGSQSGYTAGHWYYYNGSAWADGGVYGAETLDTSLSISGRAADAKATGDAIDTKMTTSTAWTWILNKLSSEQVAALGDDVIGAINSKSNATTVAPEFSASTAYTVGNYVYKDGVLYRFTSDHSGTWTGTDAEVVTVGGELTDLKSTLNGVSVDIFDYLPKSVLSAATGWRLNLSDGKCSENADYKLVKYLVTAGDLIKIISDDRFQFQDRANVPSVGTTIYRIGRTYQQGEYVLTVPTGATHLIVSTPINGSANAYTVYRKTEAVTDIFSDNQIIKFYDAGYYMDLDGAVIESSSDTWCMSCFIPVKPEKQYNLTSFVRYDKVCGNIYVIYHTATKEFLSSDQLIRVGTFTTPKDCKYIVISGAQTECNFLYLSDSNTVPKVFKRYGQDTAFNTHSLYNRNKWGNTVNWAKMGVNYLGQNGKYPKYPHGSKYAFLSAIYEGFDAILIDIIATSDGQYVVSHNDNLYPLAKNVDGTDLSNPFNIREHTLAEVRAVDMGYDFGEIYHGTKILTFEEALEFIKALGVTLVVEKVYTTTREDFRAMVRTIAKYGFRDNVLIFSYYASELSDVAEIIPEAGLLFYVSGTETEIDSKISDAINLKTNKNKVIINQFATDQNVLTENQIQTMINNGLYYSASTPSSEPDGLLEFMSNHPLTSVITHFGTTCIPANRILLDDALANI